LSFSEVQPNFGDKIAKGSDFLGKWLNIQKYCCTFAAAYPSLFPSPRRGGVGVGMKKQ
jgi:hypothetical protein